MSKEQQDEVRDFWNRVASDWDQQVGDAGDNNRRLNSDPVLWQFAADVNGLKVLDAGCGTGYLARQLHQKGATVTGVDLSERMIAIARSKSNTIDYQVDSCTRLQGLADSSFDLLIANYVLMDVPDLEGTISAFHRVLKPGGAAVLVFSHPCFSQGDAEVKPGNSGGVSYHWDFNYFETCRRVDPPWGHFKSDFIWFHRPLSYYWKVFRETGFEVTDFDEPHISPERYQLAADAQMLRNSRTRPYSVAFRLVKRIG
ncbi:MAG: methyltransferase domain-containing protein [Candidatus Delongbacteria bacterium]|nr:methyltransferase domain-containing protein [bacterium]MBL7033288.1 methyltransferase domain-containing protein [Candidatus Delongbacteria bacterium]